MNTHQHYISCGGLRRRIVSKKIWCRVLFQVHYIAMAAVVWMFTRYDLPKSFRLPVTVLLGLCVYKAFLME